MLFHASAHPSNSYNPDLESDPCGEDGCLWFFNFFFFNKKLKRIVYFSCRCTSKSVDYADHGEDMPIDSIEMTEDPRFGSLSSQYLSASEASSLGRPVNTMFNFMD